MTQLQEIAELKAGDKVAVITERNSGTSAQIHTIDRITPTQIIVDNDKFRRSDGVKIGGSSGRGSWTDPLYYLLPADNQVVKNLRAKTIMANFMRSIGAGAMPKVDTSNVDQCLELLDMVENEVERFRASLKSL
jgi:hypothetical protein